jgi:hypothetical protein
MQDPDNGFDESDNPSNGWRAPEMPIDEERSDAFEDFEGMMSLEPGEDNPLERPNINYNPLNHAYPMVADTNLGVIEFMVKFTVIRGQAGLPEDLVSSAPCLQVPVIIEDIPVSKELEFATTDYDLSNFKSPDDIVAEGALVSEMTGDERYYIVPMIVRARRLATGEPGSEDTWESLSKEEVSGLISGQQLLNLICGYAVKVAADPNAPAGLLDLLQHFTRQEFSGRPTQTESDDDDDRDSEWN